MEASIIIVTKNQKHLLSQTIPILKKQNFKKDYEIIIVDSGSTDGAREYCLKNKLKVVDIPAENFKFAHAFNTGAKEAKGKILIRLSGDCIPTKTNWLEEIIKPFKNPKIGGVFGKYILSGKKGYTYPNFWYASRFPKKYTVYSIKPFFLMGAGILNFSIGKGVYEFAGGCSAIRKKVWDKRPFNEKIMAGEDAEYSWFLHLIGYDIAYSPKVEVIHEHKIDKLETIKATSGLSLWSFMFVTNIWKYWLGKLVGIDPYKKMRINK